MERLAVSFDCSYRDWRVPTLLYGSFPPLVSGWFRLGFLRRPVGDSLHPIHPRFGICSQQRSNSGLDRSVASRFNCVRSAYTIVSTVRRQSIGPDNSFDCGCKLYRGFMVSNEAAQWTGWFHELVEAIASRTEPPVSVLCRQLTTCRDKICQRDTPHLLPAMRG